MKFSRFIAGAAVWSSVWWLILRHHGPLKQTAVTIAEHQRLTDLMPS